MADKNDPVLKRMLPFLKRADEIQKLDPLTAYYCRLYALEEGMSFPQKEWSQDAKGFIHALINKLEKDKKTTKRSDEDQLHVEGIALNIFNKADKQDRAGRADRGTAQAFYAAACFLDVCRHFDPELTPDLVEKQKYATWRAGEINKAIREGRQPTPPPADDDIEAADSQPFGSVVIPGASSSSEPLKRIDSIATDEFGLPIAPSSGFDSAPPHPSLTRDPSFLRPLDRAFPSPPLPPPNFDPTPHPPGGDPTGALQPPSTEPPPGYTIISSDPSQPTSSLSHTQSFGNSGATPPFSATSPPPTYTQPKPPYVPPPSHAQTGGAEPSAPAYPSQTYGAPPPHANGPGGFPQSLGGGGGEGMYGGGPTGYGGPPSGPMYGGGSPVAPTYGGPPAGPAGFVPSPDKVAEAHKAAKAAVSALGFSDVKTGIEYLQHSLNLLTRP